jgi:long-chain fatty acid transport protein
MRKCVCSVFISILFVFAGVASVHAGGLWLYEEATPDMGVGGAGRQAAGFDASTATGNPAAMTRLDRSQMEGGFLGLYVDAQFNVENATYGDNDGGNAGYFSPAGTLYYVHNVSPDLKLGLGVGSYFGLGVNYSNEWAGKYYVQSASFTTAAVNPTIGYRIAPWLSVGGGVSLVQGKISERVAVNTLAEPGDGRLKYDASDVGYGYNLGLLFELSPQTRVGVTYVSQVNLDYNDEMRFKNLNGTILGAALDASGLLNSRLKINMNLPAQVAVGAYHAFTDRLALVGTVNWQNWSRFGQPEISVSDSWATRTPITWAWGPITAWRTPGC